MEDTITEYCLKCKCLQPVRQEVEPDITIWRCRVCETVCDSMFTDDEIDWEDDWDDEE